MARRIGTDAPLAMVASPMDLRIHTVTSCAGAAAAVATWAPAKCKELQKAGGGWV
jgi:hypothetical protein